MQAGGAASQVRNVVTNVGPHNFRWEKQRETALDTEIEKLQRVVASKDIQIEEPQ